MNNVLLNFILSDRNKLSMKYFLTECIVLVFSMSRITVEVSVLFLNNIICILVTKSDMFCMLLSGIKFQV